MVKWLQGKKGGRKNPGTSSIVNLQSQIVLSRVSILDTRYQNDNLLSNSAKFLVTFAINQSQINHGHGRKSFQNICC